MNQKRRFEEFLRMEFSPNRFLVVSRTPDNQVSLAQQIRVIDKETGKVSLFFLKNSFLFSIEKFNEFKEKIENLEKLKEVKEDEKEL